MLIRAMGECDLGQAALLEQACFGKAAWSAGSLAAALRDPNALYLAAEESGELLGYCGVWQSFEDGEVMNVAVRRDRRREGCARRLLEELFVRAGERGVQRFTLEVREGNLPAIRLYESLGFVTEGIRKNFYDNPRENALIMWRGAPSAPQMEFFGGKGGR